MQRYVSIVPGNQMYRYKFRGVVKRIGINSFKNLTASFFVLYLSNRHPST